MAELTPLESALRELRHIAGPEGGCGRLGGILPLEARALLAEIERLREEREKFRACCTALCGAHMGHRWQTCPACEVEKLRENTWGAASG